MIWILGIVILAGVAVVVVLAALVGVFRLPVRTPFGKVMPARDLTRPAITAVVVVFVLASVGLTLFRSYHPIPAGEVGVVSEFGKIVGQVGEGPQFIAPWRDLRRVDIKVQRAEFSDRAEGLGSVAAASLETQNVFFNVTLNWQVSPEAVQGLMRNVGVDFFNTLVPTRVRQFFKAEVVKFTAVDATRLREQIRTNVAADLAADLQRFSITVVSLQIDDISYEAAFEQSIEAKQVATQDALRAQEVVAQRTAEALQAEAQAEGEAAAQIARARGDRESRILTAEAEKQARVLAAEGEAEALVLEGEAKAQANNAIAASLTTDLIQFEALKQLAGVQIAILPSGSNFLLDPTNFLRAAPIVP